ncbi:MAG TPA: DNA helicase RecQ [Gemmataceae bacterium]|nr:DNA helicase RecQ [Gemmataceae bacterium]
MTLERLQEAVKTFWGYESLRPLQAQAMLADLEGRDSLVVLPTGGGKSLCYQAPAVVRGDTTVVVSPLIALMKDQVDSLQACGIPAIQIDSSQSSDERNAYQMDIIQGAVRLLFVSPERLVQPGFQRLLRQIHIRKFAIDEAHCISHWGHDFRPEYRQLRQLRELFPGSSVHAFTATATEQVRRDIIEQLGLRDPEVLVGDFDRPNLTYRVLPRLDLMRQVVEVLERHPNEAGIVYCIRRREVDELTAALKQRGYNAVAYHAGLTAEQRQQAQDAFAAEECDLVVATVAFGMGIDRSNIRFVLHTGMPKSIEHYQQETGRAGRDSLEAECVLLHSGQDFLTWKFIIEKSANEANAGPDFLASALKHLEDMDRYARGVICRHKALVQYFNQPYATPSCRACDICLGDAEPVPDALVVAQKILSCVARVKERFGVNHVASVLRGENTENIRSRGHDQLSTFGLLRDRGKADIRDWIYQLISQSVLVQEGGDYPVLHLNPASWAVMKGQRTVRLVQPVRKEQIKKSRVDDTSWEGVDRPLFELLRGVRSRLAEKRQVQPYIIFSDVTLRELARVRPSTLDAMHALYGVGEMKLRDFGDEFLQSIRDYCQAHDLPMDNATPAFRSERPAKATARPNLTREQAWELFRRGCGIDEAVQRTARSRTTVVEYLAAFIEAERPASIAAWVPDTVHARVAAAARQVGTARLKPIFIALGEQVPYDDIRLVVAHLAAQQNDKVAR